MTGLVEWLTAQLDADEALARAATPGPWRRTHLEWPRNTSISGGDGRRVVVSCVGFPSAADADHILANDPAAVLRTVAAHREILDDLIEIDRFKDDERSDEVTRAAYLQCSLVLRHAVRRLAAIYESRPGYSKEWKL